VKARYLAWRKKRAHRRGDGDWSDVVGDLVGGLLEALFKIFD
jgi:hypothetical protein